MSGSLPLPFTSGAMKQFFATFRPAPGLMLLAVIWLLLIVGIVLLAQAAQAHSWYPTECCSGQDCAPIDLNQTPKEENGGFTLQDGSHRHIAYKDVRSSPDGKWHLCESKYQPNLADRHIYCVYGPVGGV